MESIKRQLVNGTLFLALARYSGVIINLIVVAVLARIIPPADFAIIAIIMVFANFFSLFSDFGIAAAIIQRQNLTKEDINNIFSYSIYFGILLGIVFYLSSFLFNIIYSTDNAVTLYRLLSVQILFVSFNIVPNAIVLKNKEFSYIAVRTIAVNIVTGVIAVAAAFSGLNVYALLVNPIGSSILLFILNYLKIRPVSFKIKPHFESLMKVLNYSLYNLGYNFINYASRNVDKLIIGKFMPLAQLGYYEKSYSLMLMPVQNVIGVINPVIHPILSKYQDDEHYIFNYLKTCARLFAWIGFPLSVIVAVYSSEIINIMLGGNWSQAIPVFRIFALSIGFQLVYALQGPFFLIRNKPNVMMYCGVITMLLNVSALIAGLFYFMSITYIALMIDIAYVLTFLITFHCLLRFCFSNKTKHFWGSVISPMTLSIVYISAVYLCNSNLQHRVATIMGIILTLMLMIYASGKVIPIFKALR